MLNPYKRGFQTMAKWIDRFRTMADSRLPGLRGPERLALLLDSRFEDTFLGVPVEDFFVFEFYLRNRRGRRAFATGNKLWRLYDSLNDRNCWERIDFKTNLWDNYHSLMKRDHVCTGTANYEEFRAFTVRHPRFFAKPADKDCGIGCKILTCGSDTEAREVYSQLHAENYVAEELVRQCKELEEFNASTLNTLRVISYVDKQGAPHLLSYGVLRLGRSGKVADNFGGGNEGICCPVDILRGCVAGYACDYRGNHYTEHPDSGKRIIGFQIPAWDKVCAVVKQAAQICPKLRMIGWDIAITESYEAILIEGNRRPSPASYQLDLVGKWQAIQDMLSE